MVSRIARAPGSTDGNRTARADPPSVLTSGCGSPPAAGHEYTDTVVDEASPVPKTSLSSSPQLSPRGLPDLQTTIDGPPVIATFRSSPCRKKATQRPSGDVTGSRKAPTPASTRA